ncbi:hypothetical protein DSM112329_00662 [Paraconexibacter sp. AEG42_29]|uniref:Intradiol ring-cleavage dioxygenases domain-containing protein n=1 Tax=Paraconexibacter sp. AEG42_29 TaxID=2997339 RepID=A0AAU7AQ83_9ACTN
MPSPPLPWTDALRRREALVVLAGAGAAGALGAWRLVGADPAVAADCVLQQESTEGPFYLDVDLLRRDLRGGRTGTNLALRLKVVDAGTCRPIRGAVVELWHTDAGGKYSGIASEGTSGKTFMRGAQRTDRSGVARFTTIVPGWYPGRTPHIHVKVFVGGDVVHTGQLYFRPAVTQAVYAQGRYRARGRQDTTNASDGIFGAEGGSRAVLALKRRGATAASGYTGGLTLGVQR